MGSFRIDGRPSIADKPYDRASLLGKVVTVAVTFAMTVAAGGVEVGEAACLPGGLDRGADRGGPRRSKLCFELPVGHRPVGEQAL
jgi:hypothetical protein